MSKEDIQAKMEVLMNEAGFYPTKFMDKIANAKMRLFGDEEWYRCPCDAQNAARFCISDQCKKDVIEKGRCHCNCYSNKPNDTED